jgi:hypothetical protein
VFACFFDFFDLSVDWFFFFFSSFIGKLPYCGSFFALRAAVARLATTNRQAASVKIIHVARFSHNPTPGAAPREFLDFATSQIAMSNMNARKDAKAARPVAELVTVVVDHSLR